MFMAVFQILLILILGLLFACIFSVPVKKIRSFFLRFSFLSRHHQTAANVCAVVIWYLFLILVCVLVLFLFYVGLSNYFSRIPWNDFIMKLKMILKEIYTVFPFLKNIGIETYAASLIEKLMKLPGIAGRFAAGILISFYLLIDWDHYKKEYAYWKRKYIEQKPNARIFLYLEKSKEILYSYLKGQSADALIMGILIGTGLWLIGVPLGMPIGILSGIGNLIPYTGPVIAFSLTILFCLLEGKKKALWISLIYLLFIQQIDGSYIGPKLLGRQLRIRPLFVILSVLVGGTLFGTIGIIFSVPVAAVIKYTIISQYKD